MNTEKIGDIFVDGKMVNLDNSSVQDLDNMLELLTSQRKDIMDDINKILADIQN